MARKQRRSAMRHINIGELSRGKASLLVKEVSMKDEAAYVVRYGKPLAVLISHDRYERMLQKGVDPNEY